MNIKDPPRLTRNKSGYRGVRFFERTGKWHAQISIKGKNIHLGFFGDKEDAALAYDHACRKFYGSRAGLRLNFPEWLAPERTYHLDDKDLFT